VAEIVNFHDVDSVLSKHLSLGEQALRSYRTSRGMADELSPALAKYRGGNTGGILNTAGAAFGQENLGWGFYTSVRDYFTVFDKQGGFNNGPEHLAMLNGFESYKEDFPELMTAESPEELEWVKARIVKEEENRAVLDNLGFVEGLLYYLPAGVLSPENLIPFATAFRGIGIGVKSVAKLSVARAAATRTLAYEINIAHSVGTATLTPAGRALSRKARRKLLLSSGVARNTVPQIIGLSALEGLAGGAVAEVILKSQQGLRTDEELIFGIIGGGVFGGIMGGLGVGLSKGYRSSMMSLTGHEYMTDAVIDANAQYSRALVDQLQGMDVDVAEVMEEVRLGIVGDATLNAHQAWENAIETVKGEVAGPIRALAGFEDETGWMSTMLKKIAWLNPNVQVATSKSTRVRELGGFLTSNPLINTRRASGGDGAAASMGDSLALEGQYARPSIESMLHLVELDAFGRVQKVGNNFNEYKRAGGRANRDTYNSMVARLTRRGESFDDIDISAKKDDGSYHYPGHETLDASDLSVLKDSLVSSSKQVRAFFNAIKGMAEQTGAFTRVEGEETIGNIVSYMAREYDIDKILANREGFLNVLMDGHNATMEAKRTGLETDLRSVQNDITTSYRALQTARTAGDSVQEAIWKEQLDAATDYARELSKELSELLPADIVRAEATINGILGDGSSVINGGNDSTISARIKNFAERSIDINDVDLEEFLINDVDYLMGRMIRHTVPDLFLAEYLGSSKVSKLVRMTEAQARGLAIQQKKYIEDPSNENALEVVRQVASLRDNLNRLNMINAFRTAPGSTRDLSARGVVNELNDILEIEEGQLQLGMDRINELFDSSVEARSKFNEMVDKVEGLSREVAERREEIGRLANELADGSMYTSARESIYRAIGDGDAARGKEILENRHAEDVTAEVERRLDSDPVVTESRDGRILEDGAREETMELARSSVEDDLLVDNLALEIERTLSIEESAARAREGQPVAQAIAEELLSSDERVDASRMSGSELQAATGAKTVGIDNPGGEWLQAAIDKQAATRAPASAAARGMPEFKTGGPITAYVYEVLVPIDDLLKLSGMTGEHLRMDTDSSKKRIKIVKDSIEESGFDPEQAPNIFVEYDGSARISHGNHRIRAAKEAGLTHIPVSIRYFTGGERKPGPMSFENLVGSARKRLADERAGAEEFSKKRDELIVNISSAANDEHQVQLPRVNELLRKSEAGDKEAAMELRMLARESLAHLFSGIKDEEVEITVTDATGLFDGTIEPSVEVRAVFIGENPKDTRKQVLASLAKFGQQYNQTSFYEIRPGDAGTLLGHKYDDGSFNTPHIEWTMTRELSRTEIEKIIEESGLGGLTQQEGKLTTYYSEGVDDVEAIEKFYTAAKRAKELLGGSVSGVEEGTKRFGNYSEGSGATGYSGLTVHFSRPKGEKGSATAGRLASIHTLREVKPGVQAKRLTIEQKAAQSKIAADYEALPLNDLDNPDVLRAYTELSEELLEQWETMHIKVEKYPQGADGELAVEPYVTSDDMRQDVLDNNHLYIYATAPDTFGPPGIDYGGNHPLLKPAIDKHGKVITDMNGDPLLLNDLLRAVHDYYAHTLSTASFGVLGEETAWHNHMIMTNSPWARWALTSETRGQNSWFNFSPENLQRKKDKVPRKEWPFAVQKVGLLPLEHILTGVPGVDVSLLRLPGSESIRGSVDTTPTTPQGMSITEFFQDQFDKSTNENVLSDGEQPTDLGFDVSAVERDRVNKRVEWARSTNKTEYLLGAIDEVLKLNGWPARVDVPDIEGTGTLPSIRADGNRLLDHVEAGEGELVGHSVSVGRGGALHWKAGEAGSPPHQVKRDRVTHIHGKRHGDLRKLPPNQHLSIIQGKGKFRYIDELELLDMEIAALEAAPTDLSPKASKKVKADLEKKIAQREDIKLGGIPARNTRGESSEKYFPALLDYIEQVVMQQAPEGSDGLFELKPNHRRAIKDMREGIIGQTTADQQTRLELEAADRSIEDFRKVEERRREVHQRAAEREMSVDDTVREVMEDYVVGGDIGIASRDGAVAGAIYDRMSTDSTLRSSVDDDLLGRATPESIARRASESGVALSRLIVSRDLAVKTRKNQYRKMSDLDRRIFKVARVIGEAKGGQRGHIPVNYNYHNSLKTGADFDAQKISNAVHGVIGATHVIRRNAFRDQVSLVPHESVIDMEYRTKINEAGTLKEKNKLEKRRDRDKVLLMTMISRLRNTDGFEGPEVAQKASRILRNYNYLRSMGGVVISSIPDIMMGISTAGMMNYGRAFAKTIKGEWMDRGKHRDEMALLLWAGETVLGRNRAASVFDIERPYRRSAAPGITDKIDYALGQHANKFSQLSGTNYWNGLMKGMASVAIQSRIIQISKKKAASRSISKGDQAFMNFIGMNDQTAIDVARIHESLSDVTDDFMGHTFYYSGSERWKGTINGVDASRVELARTTFQAAVHTGANNTILTPNAGVLPPELTTWWGRLFGQFRSFMAQSNETLIISGGQRLVAAKDMNQLLTIFGLTFMGTFVYTLKEALLGRDALGDLDDEKIRILMFNGLDRGGAFAVPMEMNNIIHSWLGGGGPVNKLFGVSEEAGRYRERGLWGTLAAPLSAADDLHKALGGLVNRGMDPDNDLFKSDRKLLRRAFPYQNMWWLSVGLDVAPNLLEGGSFYDQNYRFEERMYKLIGGTPKPQGGGS